MPNADLSTEKRRLYESYSRVLAELKHKGSAQDYAQAADLLDAFNNHLFQKYPEPRIQAPTP